MSQYYQCDSCKKIFQMHLASGATLSEPNPCCGFHNPNPGGFSRTMWPPSDMKHLLEFVDRINLTEFGDRRVATVFLCSALEAFLLDLVYDLLPSYTSSPLLAEKLLKRSEGKFKLIQLFDDLNKKKVKKILEENNLLSFWDDWEKLVSARNKMAHGQFFHTPAGPGVDVTTEETRLITAIKQNTLLAFHFLVNGIDPKEGVP